MYLFTFCDIIIFMHCTLLLHIRGFGDDALYKSMFYITLHLHYITVLFVNQEEMKFVGCQSVTRN